MNLTVNVKEIFTVSSSENIFIANKYSFFLLSRFQADFEEVAQLIKKLDGIVRSTLIQNLNEDSALVSGTEPSCLYEYLGKYLVMNIFCTPFT